MDVNFNFNFNFRGKVILKHEGLHAKHEDNDIMDAVAVINQLLDIVDALLDEDANDKAAKDKAVADFVALQATDTATNAALNDPALSNKVATVLAKAAAASPPANPPPVVIPTIVSSVTNADGSITNTMSDGTTQEVPAAPADAPNPVASDPNAPTPSPSS